MKGDPATSQAIEQREASRASLRARIASKPHNPWVEREGHVLQALGVDGPEPMKHGRAKRKSET